MAYEFVPLTVPFVGAALLASVLGVVVYRLSRDRIGLAFLWWSLGAALWSLTVAMRLAATTQAAELLWYRVRFLGVVTAAIGFFLFAASYTARYQWFRRERLAALAVIPAVTNLVAWTNGADGLLWSVERSAGHLVAVPEPGPWFMIHAVWAYFLVAAGSYWLLLSLVRNRRVLYRGQIGVILLGVVIGIMPNLISIADVTTVTWTPVGNVVAAVAFGSAVLRYRAFDISPIARDVVIENFDRGMLVIDKEQRVVDSNDQMRPILDHDPVDVLGKPLDEVLEGVLDHPLSAITDGGQTDTVWVSIDGEPRVFELSTSPIIDSTDTRIGHVLLFSDVTQKADQRRQLQEQKQKLQRQNERLDQFASVISHDLRSPLGVAQLRLNLLKEEVDSDHVDSIEHSLGRMETMIDDLLTMARADQAVEDDQVEQIRVRELAEAAWKTTRTESATLELAVPDNAVVEGHRSLLRTALENLFRNSLDHNERPVTVWLRAETDENGNVERLSVEDDGTGIPEDQHEAIFEYGHSTSEAGTGFGLAIVRELVQAHGWTISVTDGDAGGACFEIEVGPVHVELGEDATVESKPTNTAPTKRGR
jgi:PAS domain S-box-containing protein